METVRRMFTPKYSSQYRQVNSKSTYVNIPTNRISRFRDKAQELKFCLIYVNEEKQDICFDNIIW